MIFYVTLVKEKEGEENIYFQGFVCKLYYYLMSEHGIGDIFICYISLLAAW